MAEDALTRFEASLAGAAPPAGWSAALRGLWWQGKSDWEKAHAAVQEDESDRINALVHAHLHRVEGDLANAAYWYRRAGRPVAKGALAEEWRALVVELAG